MPRFGACHLLWKVSEIWFIVYFLKTIWYCHSPIHKTTLISHWKLPGEYYFFSCFLSIISIIILVLKKGSVHIRPNREGLIIAIPFTFKHIYWPYYFIGTGYAQALGASYVLSYYVSIIALCLYYLARSFNATLPWALCQPEWDNESIYCVPSGQTGTPEDLRNATSSAELYFT